MIQIRRQHLDHYLATQWVLNEPQVEQSVWAQEQAGAWGSPGVMTGFPIPGTNDIHWLPGCQETASLPSLASSHTPNQSPWIKDNIREV